MTFPPTMDGSCCGAGRDRRAESSEWQREGSSAGLGMLNAGSPGSARLSLAGAAPLEVSRRSALVIVGVLKR